MGIESWTAQSVNIIVAKSLKISTDQFFTHKISTKNTQNIIFPNLRQNNVNAFEIEYSHAPNGAASTCATSIGATSTGSTSTGATSSVLSVLW